MVLQEQATQTEQVQNQDGKYFGLAGKTVLRFASSLILPLMLGIFTVVVTFEQQKTARLQRHEDKIESRLQREQEWNISQTAQETQRNISQIAQEAQSKANYERYRDEVLIAYIKEIGDLLKENSGSLTLNPLTKTLARVKTLNVLRQLDGPRQTHIIGFLYEAGQLTDTYEQVALDISTAELTDIDFRKFISSKKTKQFSLAGVYLRNCTFEEITLENVNFASATLSNVNFSSATHNYANFGSARLSNVNFSSATLSGSSFPSAELDNVIFSSATLNNLNFASATLSNVNFSSTTHNYVNFASATLANVNFSSATLFSNSFSFAQLDNVIVSSARLTHVVFSNATLSNVNFSSAMLYDSGFPSAILSNINFSSAKFSNIIFSFVQLSNVSFSSASFSNIDYIIFFAVRAFFLIVANGFARFPQANMADTIFVKCRCQNNDFSHANLKGSSFHSALLSNAKFELANLQNVEFTNTTITDSQLQKALSIRNAILPNGTRGQARNLIKNGSVSCNSSLAAYWQVHYGTITVFLSKEDPSKCQFSLQSHASGAAMSQRIDLTGVWDWSIWNLWTRSNVELQANMSSGVSIELGSIFSNDAVLDKDLLNSSANQIIMPLLEDMQELEVVVKFNAHNNQSNNDNIWCSNIELFIDYDIQLVNDDYISVIEFNME